MKYNMITESQPSFNRLSSAIRPTIVRKNEFLGTSFFLLCGRHFGFCGADGLAVPTDPSLAVPTDHRKEFRRERSLGKEIEDKRTPKEQVFDLGGYELKTEFLNLHECLTSKSLNKKIKRRLRFSTVLSTSSGNIAEKSFGSTRRVFYPVVETEKPIVQPKPRRYSAEHVLDSWKECIDNMTVLFDAAFNVLAEAEKYQLKAVSFPIYNINKMPVGAVAWSLIDGAIHYIHEQRISFDQKNHTKGRQHESALNEVSFFIPENLISGSKEVLSAIARIYDRLVDDCTGFAK